MRSQGQISPVRETEAAAEPKTTKEKKVAEASVQGCKAGFSTRPETACYTQPDGYFGFCAPHRVHRYHSAVPL